MLIFNFLIITLVIVALAMVCRTWGQSTLKLLGIESPSSFDCGVLWLGFSMVVGILEFVHLLVPIDWRLSLMIFASGLLPLAKQAERNQLFIQLQPYIHFARQRYFKTLIVTTIAILWCLRSMGEPTNFDSGLYHFGSIRWMNEYPIIPGLANLHWRLGLNQSYFGFLSLVNIFPLWNKGYAVGGLFLIYLTSLTVFQIATTQQRAWRWIFGGSSFIFLGHLAGMLSNPAPDTAIGLLQIAVFCLLFRIIQNDHPQHNQAQQNIQNLRDTAIVLLLCLTLITIKLSSIAFAVMSMGVAIYLQLNAQHINIDWPHKLHSVYFKVLILLISIGFLHIVRGYLLSGAPFFPSTFAGLWGLDWAVPKEFAEFEANFIYSWARQPGEMIPQQVLSNSGWIAEWLKSFSFFRMAWIAVATVLMLLNFAGAFSINVVKGSCRYLILYLPIITAFIFWFLTAPDVRFLGAVPVLYISLSAWLFYAFISEKYKQTFKFIQSYKRIYFWIAVFIICLLSLKLTGLRSLSWQGWSVIPQYTLVIEKTYTDLPINLPTKNGQCWDAPLPCASIYNGNIHADPIHLPWPLSILSTKRFFYSVKFLNLTR